MTTNLFLFQMNDSNFPIGSFSHSYGFETYLHQQRIQTADAFEEWLIQFLNNQVLTTDAMAICRAFEALERESLADILEINTELNALLLPSEMRQANQKMGQQFLNIGKSLLEHPLLLNYQAQLKEQQLAPHPAIVFGLLAYCSQAELKETLSVYLLNTTISMVQNAVRGVPIGQVAGQKIIYGLSQQIPEMTERVCELPIDHFGATAPGIEIAQMQHEFLFARNFMS
ncbi:urease accessory protein UreF [Enterococcus sp. 669A]|uniref:Urease accessory protein UreF n=1 Tax=Candidatus Enterococcus moelleringii TaxID=2815325 RepID=A0ABS3L724_9ENTE|nr:urease accessory protein UreF [Enterococcus sp. 669A]MBO1304576.1 urease accessory protein UreF [Enterococcus sp. 669A]